MFRDSLKHLAEDTEGWILVGASGRSGRERSSVGGGLEGRLSVQS